jgi:hypothetical protein
MFNIKHVIFVTERKPYLKQYYYGSYKRGKVQGKVKYRGKGIIDKVKYPKYYSPYFGYPSEHELIVRKLNGTVIGKLDYEADDLVYNIVPNLVEHYDNVFLFASDSD